MHKLDLCRHRFGRKRVRVKSFILLYESELRLGCFLLIFGLLTVYEASWPRRTLVEQKAKRWALNLGLMVFGAFLLRFVFSLTAVRFSMTVEDQQWGLFNQFKMPQSLAILISVGVLDLAVYFQHRLFHGIPWFWYFHKLHHQDVDMDVTTGLRFHPLEILLSLIYKMIFIGLLGVPVVAVFIFEIILNSMSMWSHSNVQISKKIEKFMRSVFVTPDMHRVHHSVYEEESQRNFGFNLSLWDRVFNTYTAHPKDGHTLMKLGVEEK